MIYRHRNIFCDRTGCTGTQKQICGIQKNIRRNLPSNGNKIHLPYLAALIRLADELDIAADRNLQFLYDAEMIDNEYSKMEFKNIRQSAS